MPDLSHPTSINRDYIRLLQVMRRFVKEEFAVSIRMTQDDAIEQLLHYAEQSRNHVLQEMAKELQEFTRDEAGDESSVDESQEQTGNVRYYRGAAIVVDEEPASPAAPQQEENKAKPGGSKKIYRGRVVNT